MHFLSLILGSQSLIPINTFNVFRSTKFHIIELWIDQIIASHKAHWPLNQFFGASVKVQYTGRSLILSQNCKCNQFMYGTSICLEDQQLLHLRK